MIYNKHNIVPLLICSADGKLQMAATVPVETNPKHIICVSPTDELVHNGCIRLQLVPAVLESERDKTCSITRVLELERLELSSVGSGLCTELSSSRTRTKSHSRDALGDTELA